MKTRYLIPLCLFALVLAAAGGAFAAVKMLQVQKLPVQAIYDPQDGSFSRVSVFHISVDGRSIPCALSFRVSQESAYAGNGISCGWPR